MCIRDSSIPRLAHDIEAVVAKDLDDVETDQRLVFSDDDASGCGRRGLLSLLFLLCHTTILVESPCSQAPGGRRGESGSHAALKS